MQARPEEGKKTWFYQFVRTLVKIFSAIFYPTRAIHPERLNQMDAPYILISNHQSMMDPLLLAIYLKRYEIHFMGKRELTKFGPLGWVVEHLHMIPVSRHQSDMGAMRASLDALKKGEVLGMFPEGTRFRDLMPMAHIESGFIILALRSRVPLLPVYFHGIPRPFRRVDMVVGEPISFDALSQDGEDVSHDAAKDHIRAVYARLKEEAEQKKNNPAGVSA